MNRYYLYILFNLLFLISTSYSQNLLYKVLMEGSKIEERSPKIQAFAKRISDLFDKVEEFGADSLEIEICNQDTVYMLCKAVHRFSIIGPTAGRIWNKEFDIRFIEIDTTYSDSLLNNYQDVIVIANSKYLKETKEPILSEYDKYTKHLEKRDSLFNAAVEWCYDTSTTDAFFVITQKDGVIKNSRYNFFPECFEDPRVEDLINH